jgi:hypothetical protein
MNIAKLFKLDTNVSVKAILVGAPEETAFISAEKNEPYFRFSLKFPVPCRCSVDPDIMVYDTTEVYVRASDVVSDDWKAVDELNPENGFYRMNGDKPWVVDFSKGQELPLYQSETIREWTRKNRTVRGKARTSGINDNLAAKIAEAKAAAAAAKAAEAEQPEKEQPETVAKPRNGRKAS